MLNKIIKFLFVFLMSTGIVFSQEETDPNETLKEIEVIDGLEKIITLDFVPNSIFTLANENFVKVILVPQKRQVTLTGLRAGETSLTLRDAAGDIKARYLIKVNATDQSKVVKQIKELLGDIEGLEIGIKGDLVYVGGQIVVPSDIGRVVVILDKYPDVLRLVELSPQTQIVVGRKIQDEIQKSNYKDVTVRIVNGLFWLEGVVNSENEKADVERLVSAYLPDQIQNLARRTDSVQSTKKLPYLNLISVNEKKKQDPVEKLFKITTQFVELTKAYDKTFGFSWTPTIGNGGGSIAVGKTAGGGVTTSSQNSLSATISNLFPKLNSAKSAGYARVLQSGVIIVKDNKTGSISRTTTIPYAVGTGDSIKSGSSVAGLDIRVTPKLLQEEKINLAINVKITSQVGDTPTGVGQTAPINLDNSINTEIIVKSKDAAVVGGVVSSKFTTDFDKDAPTDESIENGLPLFSFIKSKKYSTNRSQFVLFVTPEIIDSAATGAGEIERKFRKRGR
ncbi:MAG: hypothetical protein HOP07_11150 [Bacteriovoracaceae bacterium]|nr:hypothetical protein [Bacteriovoracaceae bacterium]